MAGENENALVCGDVGVEGVPYFDRPVDHRAFSTGDDDVALAGFQGRIDASLVLRGDVQDHRGIGGIAVPLVLARVPNRVRALVQGGDVAIDLLVGLCTLPGNGVLRCGRIEQSVVSVSPDSVELRTGDVEAFHECVEFVALDDFPGDSNHGSVILDGYGDLVSEDLAELDLSAIGDLLERDRLFNVRDLPGQLSLSQRNALEGVLPREVEVVDLRGDVEYVLGERRQVR